MGEPAASRGTLRVSDLTRYLKYILEGDDLLAAVSVQGEIANLSISRGGHVYFSLKDAYSQIPCVLFRREAMQQAAQLRELRQGLAAVVHGFLTVYEPKGTFQIYVQRLLLQGEGALYQLVEQLRARLEAEGLFAQERKRALPSFPRSLALITSPQGQAYHDVLHRLRTQYPGVKVIVAGASVQGEGAADEMAMAIDIVNRMTDAELILLVRGGGAPEELAVFNAERLARAIFASRLPVVTGIGHETDWTIADLVADVRAATPSLAAAAAVPDRTALEAEMTGLYSQIAQGVAGRLQRERARFLEVNRSLLRASPQARLAQRHHRVHDLARSLRRAGAAQVRARRARLDGLKSRLDALDPHGILSRGYAVLTDPETGSVIGSTDGALPGRVLRAQVADGAFTVRVEE